MRGVWRLRRLAQKLSPAVGVLLYHRVAETETDPQLLCVTPKHFAEHLEIIRRFCRPLSLQGLSKRLRSGLLPHRSLVTTFDDGYADNLHNAKPLLERFDVPATVFVTAGQVDSMQEFWWDELERILLATERLPASLKLTLSGKTYSWELGNGDKLQTPESRRWNVEMDISPSLRRQAYRELTPLMHRMDIQSRKSALDGLRAWAGIEETGRATHRAMTATELHQLSAGGLVEVGAHTMNHLCLAALPAADQESEIIDSKRCLEKLLGKPVRSFAYPYGTKQDYTDTSARLARSTGFDCACSNFPGVVRWCADRYQLPRLIVRDWDGETFERVIAGYFQEY